MTCFNSSMSLTWNSLPKFGTFTLKCQQESHIFYNSGLEHLPNWRTCLFFEIARALTKIILCFPSKAFFMWFPENLSP